MSLSTAPRARDEFLDSPLRELTAYWLDLRCDPSRCTKIVCAPIRLLASKHGGASRLSNVIARLRCSSCHERPRQVRITDSPIGAEGAYLADHAKWSVTLVASVAVVTS